MREIRKYHGFSTEQRDSIFQIGECLPLLVVSFLLFHLAIYIFYCFTVMCLIQYFSKIHPFVSFNVYVLFHTTVVICFSK